METFGDCSKKKQKKRINKGKGPVTDPFNYCLCSATILHFSRCSFAFVIHTNGIQESSSQPACVTLCDFFFSNKSDGSHEAPLTQVFLEMTAQPRDNPYLAHLPPSQRGAAVSIDPSAREPLYGFMPRKVTGAQVLKAMVCFNFLLQT